MQKLKNAILDKLIEVHVTDAELDVLLYMSHRQSDQGSVIGVYYRTVCEELGIAYQTFYNALQGLQEKGIIVYQKGSYYDINVLILNNDCSEIEEAQREGYISTNEDIFRTEAFRQLKVNEKLLTMYFYKVAKSGRGSYHIGVQKLYAKFTELLGVSKRVIQNYLKSLRRLFNIWIKEGKYWITPLKNAVKAPKTTDKEFYAENIVQAALRRNRAKYSRKEQHDLVEVIYNYLSDYKNKVASAMAKAVHESLYLRNQGKNKYKWNRKIHPAFVHKLIIDELTGAVKA